MKKSNLSIGILETQKLKSKNIDVVGQGITKRLLDKYKPKHICNIDSKCGSKNKKEEA